MKLNCKHFSFFVVIACVSRENMAFVEIILPYFDYDFSLAPWSWGIKKKHTKHVQSITQVSFQRLFNLQTFLYPIENIFNEVEKCLPYFGKRYRKIRSF